MTLTERIESLQNAAFANGKTEIVNVLSLLRDEAARADALTVKVKKMREALLEAEAYCEAYGDGTEDGPSYQRDANRIHAWITAALAQ